MMTPAIPLKSRRRPAATLVALGIMFGIAAAAVPAAAQTLPDGGNTVRLPCGAGLARHFAPPHRPAGLMRARFSPASLQPGQLRLDYAGHSTFVVTSPAGVRVITDYNDFHRAPVLPDIATMSAVHRNHTTNDISPVISHALRGWSHGAVPPRHDVTLRDTRVYSLPVNLGDAGPYFRYETSIFVIESQGLCIAHLGLLAHVLNDEMLSRLGRIDVLLTPIDQRVSQSFEETVQNIRLIKPRLVVPMHFFSEGTLELFLDGAKTFFPLRRPGTATLTLSRATLPEKTEVLYMVPPHLARPL